MMMTVVFIGYPHFSPHVTDRALRLKKRIYLPARKRMAEARLLHKTLQIRAIKGLRQNRAPCCPVISTAQAFWGPDRVCGDPRACWGPR